MLVSTWLLNKATIYTAIPNNCYSENANLLFEKYLYMSRFFVKLKGDVYTLLNHSICNVYFQNIFNILRNFWDGLGHFGT